MRLARRKRLQVSSDSSAPLLTYEGSAVLLPVVYAANLCIELIATVEEICALYAALPQSAPAYPTMNPPANTTTPVYPIMTPPANMTGWNATTTTWCLTTPSSMGGSTTEGEASGSRTNTANEYGPTLSNDARKVGFEMGVVGLVVGMGFAML